MSFFHLFFYVICFLCLLICFFSKQGGVRVSDDSVFRRFHNNYIIAYLMAVAGDWLQGPHVYALYQSYGMSKHQIELLFIAGFGSSLFFGTFIGSFADKFGRRWNCLLYGILYGGSCLTKHFANLHVLMFGRFLGGIATSILYSAFESWLVFEHNRQGFTPEQLGTVFSNSALGNSFVAILSGVVAQFAADRFGFVAPFDVALVILLILSGYVMANWSENYGNEKAKLHDSFVQSVNVILNDCKVLCLGLVQALFEGSMYTFVLEWTPAITQASEEDSPIPHGYIFASFMVATMIGSSLFKILTSSMSVENMMRFVLVTAAISLSMPLLFPGSVLPIFFGFITFEVCVGLFWPAMASLRGKYLPESCRSTTINLFRIPLNLIVITILLQNLSMATIFQFCVVCLLLAAVAQHVLYSVSEERPQLLPNKQAPAEVEA